MLEPDEQTAASGEPVDGVAPGPLRFGLVHLASLVLPWLAALALLVIVAQRVAVTGPAGMSLPRATFFVMNAASLTGFETTWAAPVTLTPAHVAVALIGIVSTALLSTVIATTAFARVSGRRWGWARIWSASFSFLALMFAIALVSQLLSGRPAASAAWNASMVATGTGLLMEESYISSPLLWLVQFPVAALTAIGPFVLIDTFRRRRAEPLSAVSRMNWSAMAASFVLATALVVGVQSLSLDASSIAAAATAAIDARGAGFTDAASFLSPPARWALVPVLLLGGASGSVGGGLKALTMAVLLIGLVRLLRGGSVGGTFAIAAVWLLALALLFGVTFLLLVHVSPQLRADRAAILAAAACGNAGVSIDPVSAAGADAYILAMAMLLGRVLPWLVLWWSAARGDEPLAVG